VIDPAPRIVVVGAGLGGLTATLALQRAGYRPRLLEQAAALGEVGAGISVTPNATKGLESLGLGPALAALAEEPPHQAIRSAATGDEVMRIDRTGTRARYGAAYYMLHRADLHALLVEAVRTNDPSALRLGSAVEGAAETAAGVRLTLAGGEAVEADLLIAADGVRSRLRSALFDDPPARFTGHVAWRGLVPADAVPDHPPAPGSIVWAGEARSFVRYPVKSGRLVNYVGLSRNERWRGEGWSQRVPVADALAEFDGWPAEVLALIRATPGGEAHSWGLFARPPLPALTRGRVALVGDAAHPMLPFMGQGAAMAIEDGVVLGRVLAASSSLEEALARYDRARHGRTSFIQEESTAGADRLQSGSGPKLARNEDTLGIFDYDPATEPV